MVKFEEYIRMLQADEEIRRLVDKLLEDRESGECAAETLSHYYHLYYLFMQRVPRDRLLRDLEKCLR